MFTFIENFRYPFIEPCDELEDKEVVVMSQSFPSIVVVYYTCQVTMSGLSFSYYFGYVVS